MNNSPNLPPFYIFEFDFKTKFQYNVKDSKTLQKNNSMYIENCIIIKTFCSFKMN